MNKGDLQIENHLSRRAGFTLRVVAGAMAVLDRPHEGIQHLHPTAPSIGERWHGKSTVEHCAAHLAAVGDVAPERTLKVRERGDAAVVGAAAPGSSGGSTGGCTTVT